MEVDAELMTAGCLAIVTGANKVIGLSCVERLCEQLVDRATVALTSRSVELGHAAVAELRKKGHKPLYHQLDVSDENSIEALALFVHEKGGCDILINNAGIAFKLSSPGEPHRSAMSKLADSSTPCRSTPKCPLEGSRFLLLPTAFVPHLLRCHSSRSDTQKILLPAHQNPSQCRPERR